MRRKSPISLPQLTLLDAQGMSLFCGPLSALEFTEPVILALSQEFYNDPAPCVIHRSAVMQRAMMEIETAIPLGQPLPLRMLSSRIAGFLARYPTAETLLLHKETAP